MTIETWYIYIVLRGMKAAISAVVRVVAGVCLITCQGAGDELGHRELFLLVEKPRHVLVQAGDVNQLQLGGIFLSIIIKKN